MYLVQGVRSATLDKSLALMPPPWIDATVRGAAWRPTTAVLGDQTPLAVIADPWRLVATSIENASNLDGAALEHAVCAAYLRIHEALSTSRAEPVRYWNYIPGIHAEMDGGLSRYMVFNAGRFRAMERIHGGRRRVEARVATATGVGHRGTDLAVFAVAIVGGGSPVENPRQVPAYRYSERHGPTPPCFARATVVSVGDARLALVGGTAAVRGEDSMHADDLTGQLKETFENLDDLLGAAGTTSSSPGFRSLRAYVVREADIPAVESGIRGRFPGAERVEIVRADVCRPELLVEIEGIAEL